MEAALEMPVELLQAARARACRDDSERSCRALLQRARARKRERMREWVRETETERARERVRERERDRERPVKDRPLNPETRPAGASRQLCPCPASMPRAATAHHPAAAAALAVAIANVRRSLQPHIDVAVIRKSAPEMARQLSGRVGALATQRQHLLMPVALVARRAASACAWPRLCVWV